jgi:hypothetical protein
MSAINTPIGFIVSWKVPAVVKLAELRAALLAAVGNTDLAPDLRAASIVARSATAIAKQRSAKDSKALARPTGHTSRQITREEQDASGLTYTREAGIEFDESAGMLLSDAIDSATLYDTQAEVVETRTAGDVTRIVQRIVEDAGSDLIPVREQGGAYFIPEGHTIINRVRTLLFEIGGELTSFACTLGHGSDESVANTITDYMLKQIGELQAAVAELNEGGIRSDVKSRRLTRVSELRERVAAYATLVGTQGELLTKALDTAEATLLAKLGPEVAQNVSEAEAQDAGHLDERVEVPVESPEEQALRELIASTGAV